MEGPTKAVKTLTLTLSQRERGRSVGGACRTNNSTGPLNHHYPVMSVSRRSFLAVGGSLAAAAVWSSRALGTVKQNAKVGDYPFKLGVASGDPAPDGFV